MAKCSDCGKRMKPIFVDGKDYFYHQCDTCHEEFCDDCCEVDDDGKVECQNCMETRIRGKYKEQKNGC